MPVSVRRNKRGDSTIRDPHWDIVEPGGKAVGHSTTKRKASISASIRNRNRRK